MPKKKNIKDKIFTFIKEKKLLSILILLAFILIFAAGIYSNIQKNKKIEAISKLEDNPVIGETSINYQTKNDIILGNQNAPITIIEYASLSCPHCANFYNNVFAQIKEKYIDKGKVKFIYRDFPLNQSAMLASIVSLCNARNNNNDSNKYYKFIKTLFKNQNNWAFSNDFFDKLRSLAKLNGMTDKEFDVCVNNQKLVEEILQNRLKAANDLKINSTPSFIMNGKLIGGYRNFRDFSRIIDTELKKF